MKGYTSWCRQMCGRNVTRVYQRYIQGIYSPWQTEVTFLALWISNWITELMILSFFFLFFHYRQELLVFRGYFLPYIIAWFCLFSIIAKNYWHSVAIIFLSYIIAMGFCLQTCLRGRVQSVNWVRWRWTTVVVWYDEWRPCHCVVFEKLPRGHYFTLFFSLFNSIIVLLSVVIVIHYSLGSIISM